MCSTSSSSTASQDGRADRGRRPRRSSHGRRAPDSRFSRRAAAARSRSQSRCAAAAAVGASGPRRAAGSPRSARTAPIPAHSRRPQSSCRDARAESSTSARYTGSPRSLPRANSHAVMPHCRYGSLARCHKQEQRIACAGAACRNGRAPRASGRARRRRPRCRPAGRRRTSTATRAEAFRWRHRADRRRRIQAPVCSSEKIRTGREQRVRDIGGEIELQPVQARAADRRSSRAGDGIRRRACSR